MQLLTTQNAKTVKGEPLGYLTGILYLAPTTSSGYNVCPHSEDACRESCLYTAGRGRFDRIKEARIKKTKLFFEHPDQFEQHLYENIGHLEKQAERAGLKPAVRLNGTSDIDWHGEFEDLMVTFPKVQFYDYTKDMVRLLRPHNPPNWYGLFSKGCQNGWKCLNVLSRGFNVAVVLDKVPTGKYLWGFPIIDGDNHDLRFLDTRRRKGPVIVGLKAKGVARKDTTGFVMAHDDPRITARRNAC